MTAFLLIAAGFAGFIAFILGVFWVIDFCDSRERKRRDAIDRKKKLSGSNLQKLKP
jgi:hypothetical protein